MGPIPIAPPPPFAEAQLVIETCDDGTPLTSLWAPYSLPELQDMREYLTHQIGRDDGAVLIYTSDTTEVIIASRRIKTVTINTRDITQGESS
jgi:acyl-CoA synthetase (AMP-forming)/AMP-acid ligase II